MMSREPVRRAVGGFLPLEIGSAAGGASLLDLWNVRDENAWMFSNARSALAHLLQRFKIARLLLPAYICPELAEAAIGDIAVDYYRLTDSLSPDVDGLAETLRSGDCVVGVDFFGRPPASDFRALAAARDDVLWVEDRAQALWPAPAPWAEWVLYSPRKLFGVPDGGIMVRARDRVDAPVHSAPSGGAELSTPRLMRFEDIEERDNERWYAAYQKVEARMAVSTAPMSRLTGTLLRSIDPQAAMRRRCENFDVLAGLLGDNALIGGRADGFAPMGFPVRLTDRDAVWRALCERRIFPARYWPALPSDPARYPAEHALAREILLLPCDQRYGADDMRAVAAAFEEVRR